MPSILAMPSQRNPNATKMTKAYRLCKILTLGQKLKLLKHAKNNSRTTLELFCAKKRSKKTPNI